MLEHSSLSYTGSAVELNETDHYRTPHFSHPTSVDRTVLCQLSYRITLYVTEFFHKSQPYESKKKI